MRSDFTRVARMRTLFVGLTIFLTAAAWAEKSSSLTSLLPSPSTTLSPTLKTPQEMEALAQRWMNRLRRQSNGISSLGNTQGGGGGTFAERPDGSLVFWDLYAQNPHFHETRNGGKLTLQTPAGIAAHGEWVTDPGRMEAEQYLEARLSQARRHLKNLYQVIHDPRHSLRVFVTDHSVTAIREIYVPATLASKAKPTVIPGAFYQDMAGWVYLDLKTWNRAGLQSQAALLLHEKLRRLQEILGIANDDIQKIVHYVVAGDLRRAPPVADLKFDPAREPLLMKLFRGLIPEQAMYLIPAQEVTDYALKYHILQPGPAPRIPVHPEGYRNSVAGQGEILLDPASCLNVVARNSIPFFSSLGCDEDGHLMGEGILNFQTQEAEFTIEARIEGYDFEFQFLKADENAAGFRVHVNADGEQYDQREATLTVGSPPMREIISLDTGDANDYLLHVSRTQGRVTLALKNSDKSEIVLGSWMVPAGQRGTHWFFAQGETSSRVHFMKFIAR